MSLPYKVVIPTVSDKFRWLQNTLIGLLHQNQQPAEIIICVDKKPWDCDETFTETFPTVDLPVSYRVEDPPNEIKRQHMMINRAVASLDPDELVIIMDDDYWIMDRDGLSKMVDRWEPSGVVCASTYLDAYPEDVPLFEGPVFTGGDRITYFPQWFEPRVTRVEGNVFGMHPMCGMPKVFRAGDFTDLGGFDCARFRHYWFADTDLYYRVRDKLKIIAMAVECVHASHDRHRPETFAKINARRFLSAYQDDPKADPCHIAFAKEILTK